MLRILRKDLQLLWPLAALVATLHALVEWFNYRLGVLDDDSFAWNGIEVLEPGSIIGWVVLVAALAHQDRIPGTQQDWLVRPIRRLDLLLAKLAFLIVLAHGPLFVAHALMLIGNGFSVAPSLAAAAAAGVSMFAMYTLPIFALAAVTRNTMELLIAGLALALLFVAVLNPLMALLGQPRAVGIFEECGPTCGSGFAWVAAHVLVAWVGAGALAIVGLQYLRRHATFWSRTLIPVVFAGAVVVLLLPWPLAFRAQQALTGTADGEVVIAFDPNAAAAQTIAAVPSDAERRKVLAAQHSLAGARYDEQAASRFAPSRDGATVSLPVRAAGLAPDALLWADRVDVRLVAEDGREVFRGRGDALEVRAGRARQSFVVPFDVYGEHGGGTLQLTIDYWLTVLEPAASAALPAAGVAELDAHTQCGTRRGERAIQLRCMSVRQPPSCFAVTLEGPANDARNAPLVACRPNYDPFPHYDGAGPASRFAIDVPAHGGGGALGRPTGTPAPGAVTVRLDTYAARSHFTQRLVVPEFRAADWVAPGPDVDSAEAD